MSAKAFEEWKKSYYVEHGFISSEKEMEAAWNASRAALLADAPEVEELVKELPILLSYDGQDISYVQRRLEETSNALLSLATKVKAMEEALKHIGFLSEEVEGIAANSRDYPEGT